MQNPKQLSKDERLAEIDKQKTENTRLLAELFGQFRVKNNTEALPAYQGVVEQRKQSLDAATNGGDADIIADAQIRLEKDEHRLNTCRERIVDAQSQIATASVRCPR